MATKKLPRTLGECQRVFASFVPRLMDKILNEGYEYTLGDGFRDPRVFGEIGVHMGYGHPKSGHKRKIAIDLNLFKDGVYLDKTEHHRLFGEWWEKQHPLARWGGRFEDGNHYSFEWDGIK
jgi:hypothetical protein